MSEQNGKAHNSRAQFAFEKVTEIVSRCGQEAGRGAKTKAEADARTEREKREFRSLARSFPSMLQVNGLGAAAAFLFSKVKGDNAYEKLYELIAEWLEKEPGLLPEGQGSLIQKIMHMDSGTYRLCADEVMALCLWVKRFAEGMISGEE